MLTRNIFITILSILLCLSSARAEDFKTNHIIDIKLNKVTYDEAVIDVSYFYAGDGSAYLHGHIPDISPGNFIYNIRGGINNTELVITRDLQRNKSVSTTSINIILSTWDNNKIWEKEVDLNIEWPGPEYIQEFISGHEVVQNNFNSVRLISIEKHVDPGDELYKSLLLNGAPIHKVRKFGPSNGKPIGFDHAKLYIGSEVDINLVKLVISQTIKSKNINYISEISFGNNKISDFSENDIYISFGSMKKTIDSEIINKLISPETSDAEFYQLVGYNKPDNDSIIKNKYELAYKLIDTDSKNNLYRAKSLLNEIIVLDPNYPRAYLELARFHMKTSGDFKDEGLKQAERAILIAKKIDPDLADTRILLGYVYTNQGRYEEAQAEYEAASKIGSDNLWLYTNWGQNYASQNKISDAIEKYLITFNKKRAFDRNDRPIIQTKLHLFPLLIKAGRYEEADALYSKFATEFPNYNCTLLEQARLRLYKMNDYQGSIISHGQADKMGCKEQDPSLAISYYVMWHMHNKANSTKEATSAFNQAEGLALSDVTLFRELAKTDYLSPLIKDMLTKGRDINAEDSKGLTSLLYSIYENDKDSTSRLLTHGADVNYSSVKLNITPIMLAIMTNDTDMVKLILNHKPDLTKRLANGQTLSDWANSKGFEAMAELITFEHKI
ncbi:MAG: ankyrin repeat domain-containing protein [Gammaproteobacteria bacterium]|nr:ankyrin repeat domain-containing protein [Gammaproteobacteria bacterium]